MRTPVVASTILTLATTAALTAGITGQPAQARATSGTVPTHFALKAAGYGTRATGGQVPANSDTTAYQALGCTNRAGVDRDNPQLDATIPGLGTLSNVSTRVWTTSRAGVVTSHSRDSIERITLGGGDTGTLEINAVSSKSWAWHDTSGFHSDTDTSIGSIDYTAADGTRQSFPVPTPGLPVVTPLATISLGSSGTTRTDSGASAMANALLVRATTGTYARVAHSAAAISAGITHGLFSGWSAASRAHGLAGNVRSGRTPLSLMPCQGTGGEERVKSLAHLQLGPSIELRGVNSRQMGDQSRAATWGFERGRVNAAEIVTDNGDSLLIKNIVGRANVTRTAGTLVRSTDGTDVGAISSNGESRRFPESDDVLKIPGVAKLEREIVTKTPTGLFVISLRVTLLDGSGIVLDLGQAQLGIRDSGL